MFVQLLLESELIQKHETSRGTPPVHTTTDPNLGESLNHQRGASNQAPFVVSKLAV